MVISVRKFCIALLTISAATVAFASSIFPQKAAETIKPSGLSVAANGVFVRHFSWPDAKECSENGVYWCQYELGRVSDEEREVNDFKLFEENRLLYSLQQAPGSDLYISNSGICAFLDLRNHYMGKLTIHFYSKSGQQVFSESFEGASQFGFSSKGNRFGVGAGKDLHILSLPRGEIETYEKGFAFDISEDEQLVAVATRGNVKIYSDGNLIKQFKTGFGHTRGLKISPKHDLVAVIDRTNLKVFSLADDTLVFSDTTKGRKYFRDLLLYDGRVLVGIHSRGEGISKGILRVYDRNGNMLLESEETHKEFKTFEKKELERSSSYYQKIPWPFVPFDSMRTVWNYYEQHMGGGGANHSYLHQGLDLITNVGEPTYSVASGIVKCVLTISAGHHWRIAVSGEQVPGFSKGWLYAHLIESSIQFDVGDTVQVHDYLGDIIQWYDDWGHIHFVEIEDSGLVWEYGDNEWGITYNPLLSLEPDDDPIPPSIVSVFDDSKFAFCINETSVYLDPDSLYGDVDIIAKVVDYVGYSPWQQPAYETFYWVKRKSGGLFVFPRTLGQRLNHAYAFYESGHYEPYATVIYKRDSQLVPSSWMSQERNYYHILTNNNGDSLIELSEKELAFATAAYPDGEYRIFVEARDEYGNSTVDSMDVRFANGLTEVASGHETALRTFELGQNFPNPFNPSTSISYTVATPAPVSLKVYDLLGREIRTLVQGSLAAGTYSTIFDACDLASGVYLCRLSAGDFEETRKLLFLQ